MLTSAVMAQDLADETKTATLLAINKLMWIQNDLFARHYISTTPQGVRPPSVDRALPALLASFAALAAYAWFSRA